MLHGKINSADLIAYLRYIQTLIASIRKIVEFTDQFQRIIMGIERFFEIMDEPVEIADAPDAEELGCAVGKIDFDNVSFRYNDNGNYVLSHFSLHVSPGENIAVVGPSGG